MVILGRDCFIAFREPIWDRARSSALWRTTQVFNSTRSAVSGLVAAWVAGTPLMLGITIALSRHAIGTGVRALFAAVWPSALSALAMGGVVQLVRPLTASLPAPAALAILVGLGGTIYLGLSWLLDRSAISDLYRLVTRRQGQVPA